MKDKMQKIRWRKVLHSGNERQNAENKVEKSPS
jgi:hypothetical protein